MKPSDLRGILNYVPRFRDCTFVLNVDSEALEHENRPNLFLDISVLRSLNIRLAIAHGASARLRRLAKETGVEPTNLDGMGATDEATLKLATMASYGISHDILQGLSDNDLRGAVTNAIIAHPRGIIRGQDMRLTGKVEKVDAPFLQNLLNSGVIPIIPPLGFDGDGGFYRINSDGVALAVAKALKATKLIFLSTTNGVKNKRGEWITQMSVQEAEEYLGRKRKGLPQDVASKLEHGLDACRHGVSRAHVLDGRQDKALLEEIFSQNGVGAMIYANEYTSIRRALKKDVSAIMSLIKESIVQEALAPRTRQQVLEALADFYVFEIDKTIVGCVAIHPLEDGAAAEMGCLFVSPHYGNQGVGRKLMLFAANRARELGFCKLLALSTQAFNYLERKGGFQAGQLEDLPPSRRKSYAKSKRNSKILIKTL